MTLTVTLANRFLVVVTLKSNNLSFLYTILLFYAIPRFILICGIRFRNPRFILICGIRFRNPRFILICGIRFRNPLPQSASAIRIPVTRFIPTPYIH
jgi:hypothetical protein